MSNYLIFKRFTDIMFSLLTLLILAPLLILIAFFVFFQDLGTPFFIQKRVGKNGKLFHFIKFRSMPLNTPNVESSEKNKIKITPLGKILRRTNIDEIPQLYNVLIGDMSLIGPRPSIPSQDNLINLRKINNVLSIKPGLTGWAQVNSYDNMSNDAKVEFDKHYVQNLSFRLDIKIICKTFTYLTKKPPTY